MALKQHPGGKPDVPGIGVFEQLARRWRRSGPLQRFHRLSVRWGVPILSVALGLFLIGGMAYRVAVHLPTVGEGVCKSWLDALSQNGAAMPAARQASDGAAIIAFDTRMPCIDTGMWLETGRRYVIDVTDVKGWKDASYAAGAAGLSGLDHLFERAYLSGIPARRDVALPWFTLVGEIGRDSGHTFPLARDRVILKPMQPGRLYLYVNDAINPGLELADLNVADADGLPITPAERQDRKSSAWYANYLNNAGTATIRVRQED